jgi:hypothetical protein
MGVPVIGFSLLVTDLIGAVNSLTRRASKVHV